MAVGEMLPQIGLAVKVLRSKVTVDSLELEWLFTCMERILYHGVNFFSTDEVTNSSVGLLELEWLCTRMKRISTREEVIRKQYMYNYKNHPGYSITVA